MVLLRGRKSDGPEPKRISLEEFNETYNELMDALDAIEHIEAAFEFVEDVNNKSVSIGDSVEKQGYATERQFQAIDNMLGGARKWHRD